MTNTTVGQRIRQHRKRLGLTQAELHKRMGSNTAGRSFLSKIEFDDRNVTASELVSLARIFSITTDELLGIKESKPANVQVFDTLQWSAPKSL